MKRRERMTVFLGETVFLGVSAKNHPEQEWWVGKRGHILIELSTIRLQSREKGVSLGKQGRFISSFFLYDFLYDFLSKLYTINHYPQGLNPATAYLITTLIYVNSWNQLWP
jgi:hypothetical protein